MSVGLSTSGASTYPSTTKIPAQLVRGTELSSWCPGVSKYIKRPSLLLAYWRIAFATCLMLFWQVRFFARSNVRVMDGVTKETNRAMIAMTTSISISVNAAFEAVLLEWLEVFI